MSGAAAAEPSFAPLRIRERTALPVVQGGMGVGVSAHRLAGAVAACGAVGTISSVDLRRHHPDLMAATGRCLDKAKINAAIAATDHVYPVGPVKFGENHAAALEIAELQWQGGTPRVIWPVERKTAGLLFPVPAPR